MTGSTNPLRDDVNILPSEVGDAICEKVELDAVEQAGGGEEALVLLEDPMWVESELDRLSKQSGLNDVQRTQLNTVVKKRLGIASDAR